MSRSKARSKTPGSDAINVALSGGVVDGAVGEGLRSEPFSHTVTPTVATPTTVAATTPIRVHLRCSWWRRSSSARLRASLASSSALLERLRPNTDGDDSADTDEGCHTAALRRASAVRRAPRCARSGALVASAPRTRERHSAAPLAELLSRAVAEGGGAQPRAPSRICVYAYNRLDCGG
jgi:hypothetical protein